MPGSRTPYPPVLRRQIVDLERAGRSLEELRREFGSSARSIANWVRHADLGAGRCSDGLTTQERWEVRRLRRENWQLKFAREIRKKPPHDQRFASVPRKENRGSTAEAYRFVGEHLAIPRWSRSAAVFWVSPPAATTDHASGRLRTASEPMRGWEPGSAGSTRQFTASFTTAELNIGLSSIGPEEDMKRLNTFLSGLVVTFLLLTNPQAISAQDSSDALGEVRIGTQVWSVRNLDVSHFRNGDPIPEVRTADEWESAFNSLEPAWCYYDNDPEFGTKQGLSEDENRARGKLYNWYAVTDPRGLAPEGWHVPSFEEWDRLTVFLGGAGGVADKAMMVVMDRPAPVRSRRGARGGGAGSVMVLPQPGGTNSSGFTGLPGGTRDMHGNFTGYGAYGYWWSSTKFDTGLLSFSALYRMLSFFPSPRTPGDAFRSPAALWASGMSVRVVRD